MFLDVELQGWVLIPKLTVGCPKVCSQQEVQPRSLDALTRNCLDIGIARIPYKKHYIDPWDEARIEI